MALSFPSRSPLPLTGLTARQFVNFVPLRIAVPFPSQYGQIQIPLSASVSQASQATDTPLATVTIGGSVTSIAATSAGVSASGAHNGFPTWAIAVIAAVCGVLVAIAIGVIVVFSWRRRGRYGSSEPLFSFNGGPSKMSRMAEKYFYDEPKKIETPVEEKGPSTPTAHMSFFGIGAMPVLEGHQSRRTSRVGSRAGSVAGSAMSRPASRSSLRHSTSENALTAENLHALETSNVIMPPTAARRSSHGSQDSRRPTSPIGHGRRSGSRTRLSRDLHRPSLQRLMEDEVDDGYIHIRDSRSTMSITKPNRPAGARRESMQSIRSTSSFHSARSDELDDYDETPMRRTRGFTGYD